MTDIESYDVLVIGSGEAGKYLAWTMAGEGHRTAVVERKLIGGSCPNIACLPSKNIIHSAKMRSLSKRAADFGVATGRTATRMKGVQDRKQAMVEGLRRMHLDHYQASGAELVMGQARFAAPRTVDVEMDDGRTRRISGDRVFLNLGTHATVPELPGLAAVRPMTHVELLDLDRLPGHLIVMGGGYVGLELAQAMRRFGSRVTVIEQGPQLAGREDGDIAAAICELFRDEGIDVRLRTRIRSVEGKSGLEVRVLVEGPDGEDTLTGTDLLVAVGRTPNTEGIGLGLAGVEQTETGYVKVDEHLATTAPGVWAMGECAGSPQFTHVAFDDFRVVHDQLSGGSRTTRDRLVPFCMFIDPELARVGHNETEARRLGLPYRLLSLPMAAVLRTRTLSEPRGLMKMLIAADSEQILGFTVFGAEASELMIAVQVAMMGRMPYNVLASGIFTHPTVGEGLTALLGGTPRVPEATPAALGIAGDADQRRRRSPCSYVCGMPKIDELVEALGGLVGARRLNDQACALVPVRPGPGTCASDWCQRTFLIGMIATAASTHSAKVAMKMGANPRPMATIPALTAGPRICPPEPAMLGKPRSSSPSARLPGPAPSLRLPGPAPSLRLPGPAPSLKGRWRIDVISAAAPGLRVCTRGR